MIELKNIDLTGINLNQELNKRDEEYKELSEAITMFLENESLPRAREHLLEEACDNIQVVLSLLKMLGIDIPEIEEYWNNKHLEKIKLRPRKEGFHE